MTASPVKTVCRRFRFFEITPVGIVAASAGIVTMLLLARRVLPARAGKGDVVGESDRAKFITELEIAESAKFIGRPISGVAELDRPGIEIIAFRSGAGDRHLSIIRSEFAGE